MKRRLVSFPLLVVILVNIFVFGSSFNPLTDSSNKVYADNVEYDYDAAYEVLDKVNAERRARGLGELEMSASLLEAAMIRAVEVKSYFSHYRPNGQSFESVNSKIDDENIAWGYPTPTRVMNGWMSSTPHYNNITTYGYKSVGIGAVKINGTMYWTQEFSFYEAEDSLSNTKTIDYDKLMKEKGASFNRLSGTNRYESALTVAKTLISQLKEKKKTVNTVVIASGENYPDALSGTYLASLSKAPMLLINEHYEKKVVQFVKSNLKAKGTVYILGGDNVVQKSAENKLKKYGFNVIRLAGDNRYATNIAILEEINKINAKKKTTKQKYLVCSGKGFADCLSVSSVAYPILLVEDTLTEEQVHLLSQSKKTLSFDIIGGEAAVSNKVARQLKSLGTIKRVAGANRFETSRMVANRYFTKKPKSMVLTYGLNFPDGLAAGPFANNLGLPVILVCDANYKDAKTFAEKNAIRKAYAIGGEAIYSDDTVAECLIW